MDDEEYAAALLAILADRGSPGIDRYDGFGRDVWVESVRVVEGDYGAELEVGFALAIPERLAAEGLPDRGSTRVPVDQEWLELSGFEDPRDYAPQVAQKVESAAWRMVSRHRQRRRGVEPAVPAAAGTHWPALLDELAAHGTPVEVASGRIELEMSSRTIIFVVTLEQWEQVVATHARNNMDMYLDGLLAASQDDEGFVVFNDGDLAPSIREKLPPVRGRARARKLAAYRAAHPNAKLGWFAYTPRPGEPTAERDDDPTT